MSAVPKTQDKVPYTFRLAQFATLFCGMAMMIWGAAPAILQRMISAQSASWSTWTTGSLTIFVGLCLLALGTMVGSGTRWALWTTLGITSVLLLGSISVAFIGGQTPSMFAILMPGSAATTAWLALDTCRRRSAAEARLAQAADAE
jgi:hypothetical protein